LLRLLVTRNELLRSRQCLKGGRMIDLSAVI
jgi:hypothetical protein